MKAARVMEILEGPKLTDLGEMLSAIFQGFMKPMCRRCIRASEGLNMFVELAFAAKILSKIDVTLCGRRIGLSLTPINENRKQGRSSEQQRLKMVDLQKAIRSALRM